MYYFSMFLVILSSILYHLSQKSINEHVSPVISMTATYAVALALSLIAIPLFHNKDIIIAFKGLNWASYILGIAIFIIEIGFLLVYRSGWHLNTATLFSNVITAIILILIGVYVFKEHLSTVNIVGIVLSIFGILLMSR